VASYKPQGWQDAAMARVDQNEAARRSFAGRMTRTFRMAFTRLEQESSRKKPGLGRHPEIKVGAWAIVHDGAIDSC